MHRAGKVAAQFTRALARDEGGKHSHFAPTPMGCPGSRSISR